MSVSGPRCANGPFAGTSGAQGVAFVPRSLPPSPTQPRPPAPEPEHSDLDGRVREEIRERLRRGEVSVPPRMPGSDPTPDPRAAPLPPPMCGVRHTGSAFDATLGAGPAHLLAAGNYGVAIHRKSDGAVVLGTDLAHWFPTVPAGADLFDPRVLYDQHEGRWVLLAVAIVGDLPRPRESYLLLSVSQGDDPQGAWWSWVFDARLAGHTPVAGTWADHPCVGVDATALYVTVNMFNGPENPAKLRIFPKTDLYRGGVADFVDFTDLVNPGIDDSLLTPAIAVFPCHTYGRGDAELLVNTLRYGDAVTLWRAQRQARGWELHCESVSVTPYFFPTELALQKDEPKALGLGDPRVRSAVCRDGAVWLSFATAYARAAGSPAFTAARWHKIVGGSVVGGDEIGSAETWYVFPAVMPGRDGRLTMALSRSAAGEHPALCCAAWDGAGGRTLDVVAPGAGPHRKCRQKQDCSKPTAVNGWGDYNAAALDPADETTVWLYGGAGADGDPTAWDTWIARVP